MTDAARDRRGLGAAFWRFWSVEVATETAIGLAVIALQTMVVLDLGGGATEVGWLSSARFLPYVVLGLLVGAIVEGMRRRTVMLVSDLLRALVLGGLATAWLSGGGSLWVLLLVAVLLGAASLVNDAASQAFVPRLVDRDRLLPAHQRLDAGSNAAQSAGPAVSGVVIAWLGAPVSLLLAAGAHLVSAVVLATLPPDVRAPRRERGLGRSILDGLRFVHRHPRLGPQARWTHVWFLCNGAAMTLLVPLVLVDLDAQPIIQSVGVVPLPHTGFDRTPGALTGSRLVIGDPSTDGMWVVNLGTGEAPTYLSRWDGIVGEEVGNTCAWAGEELLCSPRYDTSVISFRAPDGW